MHFVTVRKENIESIADYVADPDDKMDHLSVELTLGFRMDEYRKNDKYYIIEVETFKRRWERERDAPKHNHDAIGVYANCPACDTMMHEGDSYAE